MNLKVASIFLFLLLMMVVNSARAWDVDWSRRQKKQNTANSPETVLPTKNVVTESGEPVPPLDPGLVQRAKNANLVQTSHEIYKGDRQEFVILNTAKGFVPNNVRLHKGLHYVVHIVNVNEDKKNVSFMLDAFDQHYATYFGQIKSFNLDPDKEGVFDFQCPETNSSGRLVVFGTGGMSPVRMPASANSTGN